MNRESSIQAAKQIQPFNFKKYLLGKGWQEKEAIKRKNIFLFQCPENWRQQVIVPRDSDYERYPDDILSALDDIVDFEKRSIESIITQLIQPESDILRYRIQSPQTEYGSLSLGVVDKFISGVIDSLKASICDCVSPSRHHKRMNNKQVEQLLENAQFGQTEYGSVSGDSNGRLPIT